MKVETSTYLQAVKPQLKEFMNRLLTEYDYVSILAEDGTAKKYSVSKTGVTLAEDDLLTSRGVVIKVYSGGSYSEYALNQINSHELELAQRMLRENLTALGERLPGGLEASQYKMLADEPCVFHRSTSYEKHPDQVGDEAVVALLTRIYERGMAMDERILNCSVSFVYQQYSKLFLSEHRDMTQDILWSNGAIMAMASNGEKVESYYRGFSNQGGAELLDTMDGGLDEVIRKVLELLNSEPMVPGEYDCICTPEVTGIIAHEAFGHGVEMDMFVKKRALAEKYVGEYVASPLVTMHDGAAAARETASYFFDDEGVLAQDTVIIDKGILKQGICDSQTAMHLDTAPTSNGRRQSFSHKAYTRMTNTFFEGGTDQYEDMVASIDYGFQLECAMSGMEDPKNWGIQCMVNMAREIKNGKFTGRIFSPVVLTGYVPDLLKSISMMSDTVELSGGGFCGKGYKEWVKVSDGGPYIKARIRLG